MTRKPIDYKSRNDPEQVMQVNNLCFDPKGELQDTCYFKSKDPGLTADGAYVINPLDRLTVGYDALWCITPESDENTISRHFNTICESLYPKNPKDKNDGFWKKMARSMVHGLFGYFFIHKEQRYIPLLSSSVIANGAPDKLINSILNEVSTLSFIYADLNVFRAMDPSTLYSVYANVHEVLIDFCADSDLEYCMQDNPRKVNPSTLLENSILLSIPLDCIELYSPLIVLIYNQTIRWIFSLPEKKDDPTRPYIGLIIDETVALLNAVGGEIASLGQALRLQRSKGVMMMLCIQSISGLKTIMETPMVDDELSNMPWKVFLDCTTPSDQKMICDWGGEYSRKKSSYTKGGSNNHSENYHYDDDHIITPAQLMTLGGSCESILISTKNGYNRFKKVYSFKDRFYKSLLAIIAKHNNKIMKWRKKHE